MASLACPAPSEIVTAVFCAASLIHLAPELGPIGSMALHAAIATLSKLCGPDAAFNIFLLYFALVHVPLHYARESRRGNTFAVAFSALAGAGAALVTASTSLEFELTDLMQRVVVAHILVVHWSRS